MTYDGLVIDKNIPALLMTTRTTTTNARNSVLGHAAMPVVGREARGGPGWPRVALDMAEKYF
jgi:hypothetical protein